MDTTFFKCTGLDVRHNSITCTVCNQEPIRKVRSKSRAFGTTTAQLRVLVDYQTSHVAAGVQGRLEEVGLEHSQ